MAILPSKMNTQVEVDRLDLAYQKLTGRAFKASGLLTGREFAWSTFISAGYSVRDLEVTILHIKRGILDGKRHEAALGFRRLIGDIGVFEDELQTALAERRNSKPAPTPKEQVLQHVSPVASERKPSKEAKPIGFYIEQLRKAAG